MGLRINTNVASLAAQRNLGQSQRIIENSMKALSSGTRFSNSSEGSASYAIAENLKNQILGLRAGQYNADNASSFVQVAEGGLNEQNNILMRMRELAVQSASDTYSDQEREMMDYEYQELINEFDRIAKTTSFGTQSLLKGEEREYEFQVGAYSGNENIVKYRSEANTTAANTGIEGYNVLDKDEARSSMMIIDEALTKISQSRAQFGAIHSRLESVSNNSANQIINLEEAYSRMADTDVAKAISDVKKNQALMQYQIAALNAANEFPQQILKIIA